MLRANRSLAKYFFLSLLTFGIYGIVVMSHISEEINKVASPRDGKKTMHYCLMFFLLTPITLGIASLVWYHRLCNRMGAELTARNLPYKFSAGTFWGWNILGALLFGIGPLVFIHKLMKAMNFINGDYNAKLAAPASAPAAAPAPAPTAAPAEPFAPAEPAEPAEEA